MAGVVRAATSDDLPAVRAVYRRASMSNEGDRPLLDAHPELLELDEHDFQLGRTVVALDDANVVGFATVSHAPDFFELDSLFVDPDHQRAGHATRLITALVDTARQAGVSRVEVSGNEHARAFYESVGFVQVGTAETLFATVPRMHLAVD
jgi:N-acetylglutamate synthase-like GNAT family acetyltransferase